MLPSDRKAVVWAGTVLIAIVLALWLGGKALSVLLMTFGAVLFAVFLDALTAWTERHLHLSRSWALTTVVFALVLVTAAFVLLTLPGLTDQAAQLANQLPEAVGQFRALLERLGVPPGVFPQAGDASIVTRAAAIAASTLDIAVALVVVTVVGLYFAGDPRRYRQSLMSVFPQSARDRVGTILDAIGGTLRRWLMGRVVLMVTNGVFTTIGLAILGIPLAPILGVLAGLLNFIPNLGPIIAAIPALLIALSQGYTAAVGVAVLYFILQNIDGYILTPLVDQRTVDLPPAYVLIAQVLGGVLDGTAGILLAAPFIAVCKVLIDRLRPEDLQPDDSPPGEQRRRPVLTGG